jgi:hypothetical protein
MTWIKDPKQKPKPKKPWRERMCERQEINGDRMEEIAVRIVECQMDLINDMDEGADIHPHRLGHIRDFALLLQECYWLQLELMRTKRQLDRAESEQMEVTNDNE